MSGFIQQSGVGLPSGFLDSNNQIDSSYLPSYVDDVILFSNIGTDGLLPLAVPGELGKVYIDVDTGVEWRANPAGAGPYYYQLGTTKWSIKGNAGTNSATDFIGTTDNQDLVFKRNNSEFFRLKVLAGTPELFLTNNKWITFGRTDGYRNGMSGNDSGTLDIKTVHVLTFDVHNGDIIFKRGGGAAETMRLMSTGNVSIGTTTDSAKLHIKAQGSLSTDNVLKIRNSADTADLFCISGDGNAKFKKLNISAIPTSSSGLVAGDVWNNLGVLSIV